MNENTRLKLKSALLSLSIIACFLLVVCACQSDPEDTATDGDNELEYASESDTEKEIVTLSTEAGCAHLISEVCMYPYPSMAQLQTEQTSPTGYRVALTPEMLPFEVSSKEGRDYFLQRFNAADGFSIASPILAIFPDVHVDESSLPSLHTLAESVTMNSSVQILDRETGERIPVWAEMDNYARDASGTWIDEQRSMIIRPQQALRWSHRYAVVVTDKVKTDTGDALPIPHAMQALLDGNPTDSNQIESQLSDYEDLFEFLQTNDVEKSSIVLAWEFITMSRDFAEAPLLAALDAVRKQTATSDLEYETTCIAADLADRETFNCSENPDLHQSIWRRMEGSVLLPSYLMENGVMNWQNGSPVFQQNERVAIAAALPVSTRQSASASVPTMLVGHGLMSAAWRYIMTDRDENGTLEMADELGVFAIGADFKGMATADLGDIVTILQTFDRMWMLHDSLIQGMLDYDRMADFVNTTLKQDPLLLNSAGDSLIDPNRTYYFGISLGAIAGAVGIALSEDIGTAVLHVPSAMFSSLLQHSAEFTDFQAMLEIFQPNPIHQQIILALVQRALDPIDPINWRERFLISRLDGKSEKNLLWQVSYHDANAPDFGAYALLRSADIPLVLPSTHEIFGATATISTPTQAGSSGMVLYDAGKEEPSYSNADTFDNGAHHALRCNEEVYQQVADYFAKGEEGRIVMHCNDGPCFVEGIDCRTSLSR